MKQTMMLLLLSGLVLFGAAQEKTFSAEGLAIRGNDPVAYFTESKAVKGSPEFSLSWKDATWHFSSAANRDAFRENPNKYMPQFGGYCTYGASEGHLSPTDPEAWTIADGKLYLNYNKKVKQAWLPDTATRIPAANKYWKSIQKQ